MSRMSGTTQHYHFEHRNARVIIGHKGSGIKALKELPGVMEVFLDKKSSSKKCVLQVRASSQLACEAVWSEVRRRIFINYSLNAQLAAFRRTYIIAEEKENVFVLTTSCVDMNNPVIFKDARDTRRPVYSLVSFREASLGESLGNISIDDSPTIEDNDFHLFSLSEIKKTFQNSLKNLDYSATETFEFKLTPGKYVFFAYEPLGEEITIIRNIKGNINLNDYGLKPVYMTFLNPTFREKIIGKMKSNGYTHLNENAPETYAVVHLDVGEKRTYFNVALALDENLKELKYEKDDFRLTSIKKTAIDEIFQARTVGEVLKGTDSKKIIYCKLSLLLDPDKNSHPGAAEAFKILQHAYNAASSGESEHTPSLKMKLHEDEFSHKPSKVISVKAEKTKVCTITIFSNDLLDVRVTMITNTRAPNDLSQHIKTVLNECWEKRDFKGRIPSPEGKPEIHIRECDIITVCHIWAKEVKTSFGDALFEVTFKEMLVKVDRYKRRDCLELHMKLILDGRVWKDFSADDFTNEFLKIKELWEDIRPTI